MLALDKSTGLPLVLREDFSLEFGSGLSPVDPVAVDFSKLRVDLRNQSVSAARRALYWIYRGAVLEADQEKMGRAGLRYDLLVMPPGKLGEEFVKTKGHYNSLKAGTDVSYPQLLEISHGEAFLILQRPSADPARLLELYLFSVGRGDKVIVPPGFGAVVVNPGKEVLVCSSWQAAVNEESAEAYEVLGGAGYYVAESSRLSREGDTKKDFEFAPNLNYKLLPKLQEAGVRELPQFDLRSALPMYFTGMRDPQSLDFLINPGNHRDELQPDKLFVLPQNEKSGY